MVELGYTLQFTSVPPPTLFRVHSHMIILIQEVQSLLWLGAIVEELSLSFTTRNSIPIFSFQRPREASDLF